jgi:Fe-S cluster assembly protein SufD
MAGAAEEVLSSLAGPLAEQVRMVLAEAPLERFGHLGRALSEQTQVVVVRSGQVELHLNGRAPGDLAWGRLLLVVPDGSRVGLVDRMASHLIGGRLALPQLQIVLGKGAELEHLSLSRPNKALTVVSETSVKVSENAKYIGVSASAEGLQRHDSRVQLLGSGAKTSTRQIVLGQGTDHVDYHTSLEHLVGETQSDQVSKAILGESSRGVFNGRIYIAAKAQKSDSGLLNRTLLLSPAAEINTKPELEIHADDVKAAHGATIGQLEPESLFYLRSRGVPEREARQLLTSGFAMDVGDILVEQALRQEFTRWIGEAVHDLAQ